MSIKSLIHSKAELTHGQSNNCPVVLSTRIRFARNLEGLPFPGWARTEIRQKVADQCVEALGELPQMKKGECLRIEKLSEIEKQILFERHLISRELIGSKTGSAAMVSKDQSCVIMVNEEDHLRIQVLRSGFHFKRVWNLIDGIDTEIEGKLPYAFSSKFGYLTACPTNLGTGMRASAMLHLPGLTLAKQMDKVVRAVNQLGITVRGLFGEGSEARGSIFQISNQTTLGESEADIIKRLISVLNTVIEQELNARGRLIEADRSRIYDQIYRAYGILSSSFVLTSKEAMDLLSLIRLGVDLELFSSECRTTADRLFIECQPGHIQFAHKEADDAEKRDSFRAAFLREEFAKIPPPHVTNPE